MKLHSTLRFAPAQTKVDRRPDGTVVLRSPLTLEPPVRCVGEWLLHGAARLPDRVFLAERAAQGWRKLTYGEAADLVRRVAQGLLDRRIDHGQPIAILSDNSIDHALLALGAMHAGIVVAPVSPAYSLMSKDFGKLREIFALLKPGLVFAAEPQKYAAALAAVGAVATPFEEIVAEGASGEVDEAFRRLTPDSVAKILFTSGSTGLPKGVINTHRMLTSNQRQSSSVWPFLADMPPVVVDWLPWNHTFGGNYNFFMVLANGGTMYIDGGKPVPGLIEVSVRNLRDVSPNMYFNVPRGFDLLLPYLERDADFRARFFRNLRFAFYAGAALPQNLWERLEDLAVAERGGDLALVSAWGSTETAPLATAVHFQIERSGIVGLPVPACEIKLVQAGGKLEARVRGPNVTPGYFRDAARTREAFDDEGFYRIGDAMRLAAPEDPARGLVFDGRVAEDFKLATGTWVNSGAVRLRLIAAADPLVQDAVITGHDRDEVGALVFLGPAAKDMAPQEVRQRLGAALARLAAEGTGSSTYPARLLIATEPASIDANEITDKGYINQRAVRERRAAEVSALHAPRPGPAVITA